jgi:hypothetical protein
VVFEYTATSPYELSIGEGETVKVLEEDDGSGWVKVANNSGGKGLVPASYVEVVGSEEESNVTPRTSAQYGALICLRCSSSASRLSLRACLTTVTDDYNPWCLIVVRGVYDYPATGEDEISVKEGRMIRLTTGPRGGQKYGDGWWEGQCFRCVFDAEGFSVRLISLRPPRRPSGRKEKNYGVTTDKLMACHLDSLHFVSSAITSSLSCIRFDAFISYPSSPQILDSSLFQNRFASRRTLISHTGIDENGKKGIFPSNYVRLSVPGETRLIH